LGQAFVLSLSCNQLRDKSESANFKSIIRGASVKSSPKRRRRFVPLTISIPVAKSGIAATALAVTGLMAATALSTVPVTAAPAKGNPAKGNPAKGTPAKGATSKASERTLAFNVTARVASTGTGSAQTFSSRVQSKGNRIRIETTLGDRPIVFLATPPYLYKLIPSSKAGVRWENVKWNNSRFDLQTLLRNPAAIREMLKKQGAKAIATQTVNGTLTDVLTAKNVMGQGTDVKAWLRRSDALPLRLESRSKGLSSVVSWTNYRRDIMLPDALFKVPVGYNVREAQGSPGMM
jgi:hypothetical protein